MKRLVYNKTSKIFIPVQIDIGGSDIFPVEFWDLNSNQFIGIIDYD